MSPVDLNVAVATILGWTTRRWTDRKGRECMGFLPPGKKGDHFVKPPNYSGSLDAIAEAEKTLTPEERELYSAYLDIFCGEAYEAKAHWSARPAHASADARAKAFLATKRPRTEP